MHGSHSVRSISRLFLLGGDMRTDEIDLWVSIEQILSAAEYRLFCAYHRDRMTQAQIAEEVGVSQRTISERLKKVNKKYPLETHRWSESSQPVCFHPTAGVL